MLNITIRSTFLSLFFFLVCNFAYSQNREGNKTLAKPSAASMKAGAFIDVNTNNYPESAFTITQLVKDVLIAGGSTCSTANVTNVVVSPALPPSNQDRSWGFFNRGTTAFPFEKGIILTTGNARKAGNVFQGGQLSDPLPIQGDADLAAALGIANSNLKDATFIEFDFVPSSTQVTFRYLFASEEYDGTFPCTIGDGFALLLKKVTDPTYTNLAVLPNGSPVSVTNIHPAAESNGQPLACGPANATFFGGYNTAQIQTNFAGRTVPLTATATVVPGQTYHFKMVLADYTDSAYDSGVFVKADPITVNIATPVPITCLTGNTTLNGSSSVYPTDATFNWTATNGGTIVSGGTTLNPVVSTGGTYTLTITKVWSPGATCTGTASIIVLEDKTPPVLTLTANKTTICQGESITLTATGANSYVWNNNLSGTGPTQIVTPTASTTYVINGTTLNGCAASNPAALAITVVPAITSTLQGGFICIGDQLTLDAGSGPNYTYLWNTGATSRTISVAAPGTYTVKISNGVCTKEFTAVVSLAVIPQINKVDYSFGTLTVSVNNPSNGVLEYSADNGVTWQNSNVFNNVARNIIVKLRVRVKNTSCVGYLEYFTFTMTNVITPNGDNVNDMIDFRGIVNYKDFKATIADRYGKKVYEASKLTPYWDGYFQGKKLPTSSYWYQVTFEDPASKQPQVKTGWILLKNFE